MDTRLTSPHTQRRGPVYSTRTLIPFLNCDRQHAYQQKQRAGAMTIRVCGSNGRTCGVGRGAPLSAGCGGCAALGGVAPALVFAAFVAAMHATHLLMLLGFFF